MILAVIMRINAIHDILKQCPNSLNLFFYFAGDMGLVVRGLIATVRTSLPQDHIHRSRTRQKELSITAGMDLSTREPHCYVLYVGIVFTLALAGKILRKFDTSKDGVNLMVISPYVLLLQLSFVSLSFLTHM